MVERDEDSAALPLARRKFLANVGSVSLAASAALGAVGSVAFSDLALPNERAPRVKLGRPEDFPLGERRYLEGPRLFVGRDGGGVYAVSAICTHLGCIVRAQGSGYACPCHGSVYDAAGGVTRGPAPRALQAVLVTLEADGHLFADASRPVGADLRLEV